MAEYLKHCKSQFKEVIIQCTVGETELGKCEIYLICQPLMYTAFVLKKKLRILFEPFCTPDH